jgi:bifunctional UDP-N-acetylglucosamine pyrophosphorylase/glucosamine-1-phosphate N-acetyltransferase
MGSKDKAAIILAAGKGKRMKSDLPKVLHEVDGCPAVEYVIRNARGAGFDRIVMVVGHKYGQVMERFKNSGIDFAVQRRQLGTGHAVKTAESKLEDFAGSLLVLAGDMPLVSSETISMIADIHVRTGSTATVLSVVLPDPTGYGRIVRNPEGEFIGIVEHRDASPEILKIKEVNTSIICFDAPALFAILDQLECDNEQGEYYLTDTIRIFSENGQKVTAVSADDYHEGMGINSVEQLHEVEQIIRSKKAAVKKY